MSRKSLVFRDGRLHVAIDFDTASPGPRIWDLAHLAYRLVPLTAPGNPDAVGSGDQDGVGSGDADAARFGDPDAIRAARLEPLCEAYGGAVTPDAVVATAARARRRGDRAPEREARPRGTRGRRPAHLSRPTAARPASGGPPPPTLGSGVRCATPPTT